MMPGRRPPTLMPAGPRRSSRPSAPSRWHAWKGKHKRCPVIPEPDSSPVPQQPLWSGGPRAV